MGYSSRSGARHQSLGRSVDHVIALVGAAYVEKALEVAIAFRLVALSPDEHKALFNYEKNGPLADLSAKIKMSFALDIIGPKTRDDLNHIREIRNNFAHTLQPIGFETKEVVDICDLLHTHRGQSLMSRWTTGDDGRACYINTTLQIGNTLKNKLKVAQKEYLAATHKGQAFPVRFMP